MPSLTLPREQLKILILGPGEDQPTEYTKRIAIRNQLRACGYTKVKLGEEILNTNSPLPMALLAAVQDIDLILVLESGPAPLAEISILFPDYAARDITRVWCPRRFFSTRRTMPIDIVRAFEYKLYSESEFTNCDLTAEFIQAAERFCFKKAQREGLLSGLGLLPPRQPQVN